MTTICTCWQFLSSQKVCKFTCNASHDDRCFPLHGPRMLCCFRCLPLPLIIHLPCALIQRSGDLLPTSRTNYYHEQNQHGFYTAVCQGARAMALHPVLSMMSKQRRCISDLSDAATAVSPGRVSGNALWMYFRWLGNSLGEGGNMCTGRPLSGDHSLRSFLSSRQMVEMDTC